MILTLNKLAFYKIHILFILGFSLIPTLQIFAQQDALYVTYPQNPLAINPAYAGSSGIASVSVMVRKQSLILQGLGSSQYLSYNTPLAKGKFGMGFQAFNSNFGQAIGGGTGINLGASFRHHFSDSISISIGAQGGFVQIPSYITGVNEFKPITGAGAYFRSFNSYLGVSMPIINRQYLPLLQSVLISYSRPIFVSIGHVFTINDAFDLKIGTLYRHLDDGSKDAVDLHTVVWYKKRFGLGLWKNKTGSEINPKNAFIITADAQVSQKFRLGFSYDAAVKSPYDSVNPKTGLKSKLSLYNFTLRYDFDNLTGKIDNFRFF
jgi:type IX secretion system PorP/SprF family membrane protein